MARRRYIPTAYTTHYEVVVDNGETEERHSYSAEECEMAASRAYRAKAAGAFSVHTVTYKSDGTSYTTVQR